MNVNAWIDKLRDRESLPGEYRAAVLNYIVPLGERIQSLHKTRSQPIVVGIAGAQGCGKSTFSFFLENWLVREAGIDAITLALDDLYFDRQARDELGHSVHPLLRTRGVPGTHDAELGSSILQRLTQTEDSVSIPAFDKVADDTRPRAEWKTVSAPVDIVLFEGWCVGARPQQASELEIAVNELERAEDADAVWRRYVNDCLGNEYAKLFSWLDMQIFLQVPSFAKVLEWRGLQEKKQGGPLANAELRRFVQHFERLSRHMLDTTPGYADVVIGIGDDHQMTGMQITDRSLDRTETPG